jgi:hypothetical protein
MVPLQKLALDLGDDVSGDEVLAPEPFATPKGPHIPYRLPQLIAASPASPVYFCEGRKNADAVAALGFVATTHHDGHDSRGGGELNVDLSGYFKDRHAIILPNNDKGSLERAEHVAGCLDPIAASVKIVALPGLPSGGGVSDFLKNDPAGARLAKCCRSTPRWEPGAVRQHLPEASIAGTSAEVRGRGPKQADRLIELAAVAELFHAPDGVGFADIEINGHRETWSLRSKGFKQWLTWRYFEAVEGAPSSEALNTALNVIEARARFAAAERTVHVRVGALDGRRYLDLCNKAWEAVQIDVTGWRVIERPPVRFRRKAGMLPLPVPMRGGTVGELRPFLNLKSNDDFVLVVAALLAYLLGSGPYPVLALSGEHGTAKSTFTEMLRALIDPNTAPLRALPRENRDLFIAANNAHVLAFDNISAMPLWVSDSLCRLATGGGFAVRQLYTDQDEVLFDATRPVILNGIEDVVTRPDLADRCIFLTLEPIPEKKRRPGEELWGEFERMRPLILAALLDAVVHGLQQLPRVHLDRLPRMADFARWSTACETAIWPAGTFHTAYAGNRDDAIADVIDADSVAGAVRSFMATRTDWRGTASELLGVLAAIVGEAQRKDKSWPGTPRALSGRLRRAAPVLRKVGIEVAFSQEGHGRTRTIHITSTAEMAALGPSSPPASPAPEAVPSHRNGLPGDEPRIVGAAADDHAVNVAATLRAKHLETGGGVDADDADDADANVDHRSDKAQRNRARWKARL